MKAKNLALSLIFPVICCLFSVIPTLISFQYAVGSDSSVLYITTGSFGVTAGLFPLVAVILLKADISSVTKWQAMFTASAAVSVLIYAVTANFAGSLPYFLSVLFMIIVPLAFTVAAGITYGNIFHRESGATVLKWFTAFLSTPVLWYFLFMLVICIVLNEEPFELSYSHMG